MAGKPTCLVCQKEMVRGFVSEIGPMSRIYIPLWCEGEPQPGAFSGTVRDSQYNSGLKVVAYRCPECEALRLYAPSAK